MAQERGKRRSVDKQELIKKIFMGEKWKYFQTEEPG
jgi:hypothetical protein